MLFKDGTGLEDARRLADYKIENDEVLGLAFALPGASPPLLNCTPPPPPPHAARS